MTNIKISIIVPNFNHAHYLSNCLDSILAQKVLPHEVIMIDDCSSDNSLEVMRRYTEKSPIFTIVANEQNMGVNKSINSVLPRITGTHMFCLAADDWMLPDLLQEAYEQLNKHPDVGFWSSGSWIIYEDNTEDLYPILINYPIKEAGYIDPETAKQYLYKYDSWFCGNTVVHDIRHFKAEQGWDPNLRSFADGFYYRIVASKYGCCFTPKRLGVWRIRRESHSQVCANQIDALTAITDVTMHKLSNEYKGLFSNKLVRRIHSRLLFSTVKIIWQQDGYYSARLNDLITSCQLGIMPNALVKFMMNIISKIPVKKCKIGQLFLLINYKPFDVVNMIKAKIVQRMPRSLLSKKTEFA